MIEKWVGLVVILLASVAAWPRPALAHPQYPTIVQNELSLPAAPSCLLCHTTALGQKGTAERPFANTLKSYGLPSSLDPTALGAALERMTACASDSDGDGQGDVDELLVRSDPNDGPGPTRTSCQQASYSGPLPETGCTTAGSRATRSGNALAWLALAPLLLVRRRRRAPAREQAAIRRA